MTHTSLSMGVTLPWLVRYPHTRTVLPGQWARSLGWAPALKMALMRKHTHRLQCFRPGGGKAPAGELVLVHKTHLPITCLEPGRPFPINTR